MNKLVTLSFEQALHRFTNRMIERSTGSEAETREHARQEAGYYDDIGWLRTEPEACADDAMSYWGEG
ncbi:hypothetical protein [uncultured Novosphingobium sp.]|uniref:hypothetical protein n=1 Tax=uncultured Novosphingobium sp. TaxID=292277 RepID=UPI0037488465